MFKKKVTHCVYQKHIDAGVRDKVLGSRGSSSMDQARKSNMCGPRSKIQGEGSYGAADRVDALRRHLHVMPRYGTHRGPCIQIMCWLREGGESSLYWLCHSDALTDRGFGSSGWVT